MRYGVFGDVHANLHALLAVLERLRRLGVDRYLCTGDLVGYGPHPNECVQVVAELEALCVAGNHDLIAVELLPDDDVAPFAQASLRWTRSVLNAEARGVLSALPLTARIDDIVVAHGTLDSPSDYTWRPDDYAEQLNRLHEVHADADTLVLGHYHEPVAWGPAGGLPIERAPVPLAAARPRLLNPGSVGQSRELRARARFLVLDTDRDTAAFHAVPYDVGASRRALRERGLHPASCHDSPLRPRRLVGAVRRLVR